MTAPVLHASLPVRDLAEARRFYELGLGCEVGRVRETWLDVWFFGLQLTLQERPDEVLPDQGCRHLGVVLPDREQYEALVTRLESFGVEWVSPPTTHDEPELSGKRAAKVADPSGNVLELKHYPEPERLRTG